MPSGYAGGRAAASPLPATAPGAAWPRAACRAWPAGGRRFGKAREQCLLDTLGAGRRLLVFPRRRLGQHGREQLVEHATPAKEDAERLLEDERVLVALHQYRMQRPIEIVARADARRLDRRERVHHRPGTDRNAGSAPGAGEVEGGFG